MAKIDGMALKRVRETKGLSQQQLAEQAQVDVGTISRIERQKSAKRPRARTLEQLARVLKVDADVLSGAKPPPASGLLDGLAGRKPMNIRISDASRNALTLVARRYRVGREAIVEAAPLLFYLIAEQSLRNRRQRVDEADSTLGKAEDALRACSHFPHLSFVGPDEAVMAERSSIDSLDLFGRLLLDRVGDIYIHDWDEGEQNAFANFIRDSLSALPGAGTIDHWYPGGAPRYEICRSDAEDIVGMDEEAVSAVLSGTAPLHEMPPEIRAGGVAQKASWAKERAAEAVADIDRLMRDAGIDLSAIMGGKQ